MEVPLNVDALKAFEFERVLIESSTTGSIYLLGTIHAQPAIVHLQRTLLSSDQSINILKDKIESLNVFLENRPYFSSHAFLSKASELPDVVIKLIWPATGTHIKKYNPQPRLMVSETPEIYEKVVVPYIQAFPPERLGWVYQILEGKKEVERVLYKTQGEEGFLILPDLKWDQTTMSALYLVVLVNTRSITSLRDLKPSNIPLLKEIRDQARKVAKEKFGVEAGKLRLFVHYQPSYYHFHVHVVHIDHEGLAGMTVGQAHLLDDLISLLELSTEDNPILARMTLTYALGVEHDLYAPIAALQAGETVDE